MAAIGVTTAVPVMQIDGPAHPIQVGSGRPLTVIAGPCVIEDTQRVLRIARGLAAAADQAGLSLVFKASFDKANRTSLDSYRGPGLDAGLAVLRRVRDEVGLPVTTDVHLLGQVQAVADAVDLVQVPAFLCRQTDLLVACAQSGRPVNVKKGQFLAPSDMAHVLTKLRRSGAVGVMLTERGSSFGYNHLVVDMAGLPTMRALGVPVCFDATHSVQRPGGLGERSGGDRGVVPFLARAAVAVGIDAVFMEVHDDPDRALSDGPNMVCLDDVPRLLCELAALDRVVKA